jgi:hypothetical protein
MPKALPMANAVEQDGPAQQLVCLVTLANARVTTTTNACLEPLQLPVVPLPLLKPVARARLPEADLALDAFRMRVPT